MWNVYGIRSWPPSWRRDDVENIVTLATSTVSFRPVVALKTTPSREGAPADVRAPAREEREEIRDGEDRTDVDSPGGEVRKQADESDDGDAQAHAESDPLDPTDIVRGGEEDREAGVARQEQ